MIGNCCYIHIKVFLLYKALLHFGRPEEGHWALPEFWGYYTKLNDHISL